MECERVSKVVAEYLLPSLAMPSRVRLGALRLRMRIEAYRWRTGKIPVRLLDAAPFPETLDPRTQTPFSYEPTAGGYRLGDGTKTPHNPQSR